MARSKRSDCLLALDDLVALADSALTTIDTVRVTIDQREAAITAWRDQLLGLVKTLEALVPPTLDLQPFCVDLPTIPDAVLPQIVKIPPL